MIDGDYMRTTAPNVIAELLERRLVYKLESACNLHQKVTEPEDYPILDSVCKDYLYMRYVETSETKDLPTRAQVDSHLSTAIYRRQSLDPWASQSTMPTCTHRQIEAWSAAGKARSMIAKLNVRRCKSIGCKFEFLPATMDLGCEEHRRLRELAHTRQTAWTKSLGYVVETPFDSSCIDQHCCPGRQLTLTAVDRDSLSRRDSEWIVEGTWDEENDAVLGASGLSQGLWNFAQGLAVFGRILEEQHAASRGEALQYSAARFQAEADVALQYLKQRMVSLLTEDESSAEEEEQDVPCDQREQTKEGPDEQDPPPAVYNDASEHPEVAPPAPNRLDDATQQALLLDAAISSTLAPWDLPRSRPAGGHEATVAAEEADHPALRSQSAMEAAAYGYLEHHLPGFGASNWRSEHRETFLGSLPEFASGQQQSGFAFEYEDRQGLLSSDGTPHRLLIGVKGNASRPFELTAAEHAAMQSYTRGDRGASGGGDAVDSGAGAVGGAASGLLSGLAPLPTEFILLHMEANSDGSGHVTVSHAVHDPHRAGLAVEPATFFARW